MSGRGTRGQFWRFVVVGAISNAVLYALYLVLTRWGLRPKIAMTVVYGAGVVQTFVFNKQWAFRSRGPAAAPFRRYVVTYAAGYALNLGGLSVLVDSLGWAHELAQGILIVVIAVLLFLLQKFWVFRAPLRASDTSPPTP
jgi:putative flippase GtrA